MKKTVASQQQRKILKKIIERYGDNATISAIKTAKVIKEGKDAETEIRDTLLAFTTWVIDDLLKE